MRLYVVGEKSSNPEDWSQWSEYTLVLAESVEQVIEMCGDKRPITLVDMSRPAILCSMAEPAWGEDL